jgi:hypothetical protein
MEEVIPFGRGAPSRSECVGIFPPGPSFGLVLEDVQAAIDVLVRIVGHDDSLDVVLLRSPAWVFIQVTVLSPPQIRLENIR